MAGISIAPTSDLGKKATQIGEIAAKYSSKIVFSKNDDEFEKNYQDMLNEMEKQEPQKIVDEYNRLLEAAKAKVK
jgi:DNA topoisomerase IB